MKEFTRLKKLVIILTAVELLQEKYGNNPERLEVELQMLEIQIKNKWPI
jgi:hypothetical protein